MTLASALAETRERTRLTAHQPLVAVGCAGANIQNRSTIPTDSAANIRVTPTFESNSTSDQQITYDIEIGPLSFGPFRVTVPAGREEEEEEQQQQRQQEEDSRFTDEEGEFVDPGDDREFGGFGEELGGDPAEGGGVDDTGTADVEEEEEEEQFGGGGGALLVTGLWGHQATDERTVTVGPGELPAGSHEVAVQQRFGQQQRAVCGSVTVEEAQQIERPFVEMSCSRPASSTTERGVGTDVTTAVRLRNKDPENSHAISYEVFVGEAAVGSQRVTVNAGQTQVDERTFEVPASLVNTAGELPVTVRQQFGVQQEFRCGSASVQAPQEEEEQPPAEEEPGEELPQLGGEVPPAAALGAVLLVLVLAFAS